MSTEAEQRMGPRRHLRVGARAAMAAFVLAAFFVPGHAGALTTCQAGPTCPNAADDSYVMTLGSPLRVGAPGLLANDSGVPGTTISVVDSDDTSWNNATVDIHEDGSFTFTPNPDDPIAGADSFGYAIQDAEGGFAYGYVYVQVNAIVRNDLYTTGVGKTLRVPAPGIFANDAGIDTTSVTGDVASKEGGVVNVNDDGSFDYEPPSRFRGADTFNYDVFDTNNDLVYTGTVLIGVGTAKPSPGTTAKNAPNDGSAHGTLPGAGSGNTPGSTAARGGSGGSRSGSGSRSGTTSTTAKSSGKTGAKGGSGRSGSSGSSSAGGGETIDGKSAASQQSNDSGTSALPIVIALLVVAGAAGGAAWWWRRRRSATPEPPAV